LLLRVKANDQDGWQRLVSLYSPLVMYWCRQGGVQGDDVPDVAQEVFGAVAAGLKAYRQDGPGASFRAWLRGIARHKIRDHLRRGPARAEGGTEALVRLRGVPVEDEAPELSEGDGEVASLYRRALD
jgi:RNA polymerase sigma-70 factor (ECF subfamily)